MASSQIGKSTVNADSMRNIISAMPLMVVAIDQNGIFVEWNKVAEKVTGWSAAEIIGHPDPSSVLYPDPEYLRELRQRWNENSGQYMNQIWKLRCKDGLWKWISWSNISYDYPVQGWTSWALGTDVSDVIEVTEKLQKKEHNLETIAQVSEVLLSEQNFDLAIQKAFEYLGVSSNADRVYIFENDHNKSTGQWFMNQTYEWTKGGILKQIDNPDLQNLCYAETCPRWQERMLKKRSISGRIADFPEIERSMLEPQGIISLLAVPIYLHDEWWGFIGFDNCTTTEVYSPAEEAMLRSAAVAIGGAIQRERINQQLREARLKAEELNRLKSNLLANISHELRTPLIGILGFAEILVEEVPDPAHKKIADTIRLAGQRLSNAINLILDLSQIESDRLTVNIEQVNLAELIRETIDFQKNDAAGKGLYIKASIPENLPLMKSDRRMLQTILDNLLSNAIKFTNEGGVDFRVTVENGVMSRRMNVIVSDTGIGISPDLQSLIFEAFRQGSEGLSRNFEGVGLGLTIIRKFAEKLGGSVEIQSKQNVGTTFTISFPTNPETDGGTTQPENYGDLSLLAPVDKKRIVIVETDPASETMVRVFARPVAEVVTARNSDDVISAAGEKKIDMIIFEINPRNFDHIKEVIHFFRSTPALGNVPVLAFSSLTTTIAREKFEEQGFDGLIPKPVTKSDFLRAIHKFL